MPPGTNSACGSGGAGANRPRDPCATRARSHVNVPGPAPHEREDARLRLGGMPWRATLPLAGALALGIGLLLLVQLIARPLAFLVIAIAIAEALEPVVRRLERSLRRSLAIAVTYAVLLGVFLMLAWLVVPVLITQGQELLLRAPELVARVEELIDVGDSPFGAGLADAVTATSRRWAGLVIALPLKLLAAVVDVLVVVFLSIYWLIGAPDITRFTLSLLPERQRERAREVLDETGRAMGGYVRGAAINAVIMGTLAWAGLWLIGVRYSLALGVITMLAEPIPIVGPLIVAIPVVAVALLQSPQLALGALALYTVLQQLEGQLLTPNIMRSQTDMPQTVVLFAVMAGGAIGGLLGILAALPLAAALRVLTLRLVVPVVRRWTGADATPPGGATAGVISGVTTGVTVVDAR